MHVNAYTNEKELESNEYIVESKVQGLSKLLSVTLRPGCLEFLENLSQNFELILYTSASHSETTAILQLLKHITHKNYFSEVLTRDDCLNINGRYHKNIDLLIKDGRR